MKARPVMKGRLGTVSIALLAFGAGTVVSFFTLPLWVTVLINAAREGSRTDWLGFAGGLIGNVLTGVIAAAAIVVTWRGIRYQLRINLISREEERIERVLPGLREAVGYIQELRRKFGPIGARPALNVIQIFNNFDPAKDRLGDKLKLMIPSADDETRQRLLLAIETVWDCAMAADMQFKTFYNLERDPHYLKEVEAGELGEAQARAKTAASSLNFKMLILQKAVGNLHELEKELTAKIDRYEARLPKFRRDLESFFND